MNSLRPERDELDRFKRRKEDKKVIAPVKEARQKKQVERGGQGSPFLIFVVFVLACLSGALAWGYIQQESRLDSLKTELSDALGFIGQSKLSMARFEGELNETGAELEQSGSAAAQKLAFLDSEMRKLWGVANDRNKQAIENNALFLSKLEANAVKQEKKVSQSMTSIEKSLDSFEAMMAGVNRSIKSVESQVSLVASEATITREAVDEDLSSMRNELKNINNLKAGMGENRKAISSIDAHRKQLNERIVDLGQKLNALQLQVKSSAPSP